MPIINGQKVACAPCIRGHRSTKCNHATERVMIPVRKPGRPLSTCPCPPDRPCGCGGIKVAIPRKQKCHCGGPEDHDSDDHAEAAPIPSETPASPTATTRPQYRVNKPGSGSRQNSRKPSFEPSQLGRIDPNSVNIVNHFGSMNANAMGLIGNHLGTPVTAVGGPAMGYVTSGINGVNGANGFGAPMNLGYQTPMGFGPPQQQIPQPQQVSQSLLMQNGIKESQSAMSTPLMATIPLGTVANGTNGHNGGPLTRTPQPPAASPSSPRKNGSSSRGGGSCCGGPKKESPEAKPTMPLPLRMDANKTYVSPQLPPAALGLKAEGFQDPFTQQTVYTYPATYGSFSNPVNQDLWLQISGMTNPLPSEGPTDALGFSHECSCGPGCSCVGCLAHPFNQEMFNYVNNAYNDGEVSPTDGYRNTNGHTRSSASVSTPNASTNNGGTAVSSCCGGSAPAPASNNVSSCCGSSAQAQAHGAEPSSPPTAHTPSDASGFSEEQSLSTSDYFFVNIPFDPSACNGSEVFCPCGDDCSCEGCFVHKNNRMAPAF